MLNVIRYHRTPQKIFYKPFILPVCLYQTACQADNSLFMQRLFLIKKILISNAGQRQECCASEFIAFQKLNHTLRCIFILCDNILNTASESCFNCRFVGLFYFNNVCHYPKQPFFLRFPAHHLPYAVPIALIPLRDIFQRLQPGSLSMVRRLSRLYFFILGNQLFLDSVCFLFILSAFFQQFLDFCRNHFIVLSLSIQ